MMTTARAQDKRERIIRAAQDCFEAEGFHGASMARIAATADVSAGLIYRYFASKEAIIEAIVQRQLEAIQAHVDCGPRDATSLAQRLTAEYGEPVGYNPRRGNPKLGLELSAESTRNPAIGAVVRRFDTEIRRHITQWLAAPVADGGRAMPPTKARERALMLQIVIEGLMVREAREPDLDRALLGRTLARLIPEVLDA